MEVEEVEAHLRALDRPWRRVGRVIYVQWGPQAHALRDTLIGLMDTDQLAEEVIRTHNRKLRLKAQLDAPTTDPATHPTGDAGDAPSAGM